VDLNWPIGECNGNSFLDMCVASAVKMHLYARLCEKFGCLNLTLDYYFCCRLIIFLLSQLVKPGVKCF
jgi:hypothetical protein